MRTRNTKKAGQTPPTKKVLKASGKDDSGILPTTEPAVTTTEPEIKLEVQIQEAELAHESIASVPELKLTTSESNGDNRKVVDTSHVVSSENSKDTTAIPTKTEVSSTKKQMKARVLKNSGAGAAVAAQAEQEMVVIQSEEEEDINENKKDSDAMEATQLQTKLLDQMDVEDATNATEGIAEEDGNVEGEEEAEGEGKEDSQSGESENDIDNEDGEEEESEGDREEEGEEEEEGDEAEGGDVVEDQPELQEPKRVTERLKRKHFEVFVGGLAKDSTEDDIKKAVQHVGEVVEVRLMKKYPGSGKNKGYAFVRFATPEQAKRAAIELNRAEIKGKLCEIVPSEDNDVLFLGNVNNSWKKEQVEEKLKEYAIEGIEELTLMENQEKAGEKRGFALLKFGTHKDARKALKRLAKPDAVFGAGRSAKVAWAYESEPDEAATSQVKSVFVDGIPSSWTEEKVKEYCHKYGAMEEVVLNRRKAGSKQNDYAIVTFATHKSAIACIDALKDVELVVEDHKVKLKARLDKPPANAKGGKGIIYGDHPIGGGTPNDTPKKPKQSEKRLTRGKSSSVGRRKRAYEASTGRNRAVKKREFDEHRPLPVETQRRRWRRLAGRSARLARVPPLLRGRDPRREDLQHGRRLSLEYRSRHDDAQSDYPSLPSREFPETLRSRYTYSGREPLPLPRDNGYMRWCEQGFGYEHDAITGFNRARDYDEPVSGIKRSYSLLDDGSSYYESDSRGFPRVRIADDVSHSSHYDFARVPVGRSSHGLGGGSVPVPLAGGAISQYSLGLYNQSGTHGGSSGGRSSLYGVGDYISSGTELRGLGPLFGSHLGSGGYSYLGASTGSYY